MVIEVPFEVTEWFGKVASNQAVKVLVNVVIFNVEDPPSVTAV